MRIEAADAILVFVSQNSMASPFCGMEIIVAREYGKRLYPIYLDDSVIPPAFEILLSNTHHSTVKDRKKLISTMTRDLPAEAMDRLTIENDRLEKCEDNGKTIQVDEGITTICHRAFQGRRALHHIQLPTTLRTIAGQVKAQAGSITYNGEELLGKPSDEIVKRGITLVPEGRRVFPDMTVLENMKIGAYLRHDKLDDDIEWCYELFPRLKERHWQLAGTLSGGEQQMLAVARALMSRPKLMMMDEPSLGLAPLIVRDIFQIIREINKQGVTILLIEQNANMALHTADRGYVMETGEIILEGAGRELLENPVIREAYLGK